MQGLRKAGGSMRYTSSPKIKNVSSVASVASVASLSSETYKTLISTPNRKQPKENKQTNSNKPKSIEDSSASPPMPLTKASGDMSSSITGRPSIETMMAQWEFMKSQFVNSNDDLVNY